MSQIERECKIAFTMYDKKNQKELPQSELKNVLEMMGYTVSAQLQAKYEAEVSKFDQQKLVELVQTDFMLYNDQNELMKAFQEFDPNATGAIVVEDFRNIIKNMGEPIEDQQLDSMIKMADPSATGKIDYKAFAELLVKEMNN